jgi:hypothetical protein
MIFSFMGVRTMDIQFEYKILTLATQSANENIVRYVESERKHCSLFRVRPPFTLLNFYTLTSEPYKNVATILYHILICHWSGCDTLSTNQTHHNYSYTELLLYLIRPSLYLYLQ